MQQWMYLWFKVVKKERPPSSYRLLDLSEWVCLRAFMRPPRSRRGKQVGDVGVASEKQIHHSLAWLYQCVPPLSCLFLFTNDGWAHTHTHTHKHWSILCFCLIRWSLLSQTALLSMVLLKYGKDFVFRNVLLPKPFNIPTFNWIYW